MFPSVNTKVFYTNLGWRFIEIIEVEVLVIRSSLSSQEVKRQRIADLFRAGVEIKLIAETRSLCEHCVQC